MYYNTSFSGAYLNKQQPHGGRTIVPDYWLHRHNADLPFPEWEITPEPHPQLYLIPQSLLEKWRILPDGSPTPIKTEQELSQITNFISPICIGGLGTILFQIAACHVAAKAYGIQCIFAWWDQPTSRVYQPYHSRSDPAPGITIQHIFPNLKYVDVFPSNRKVYENSMKFEHEDQYQAVNPSKKQHIPHPYMFGKFHHPQCLFSLLIMN